MSRRRAEARQDRSAHTVSAAPPPGDDAVEVLVTRARRLRRRGDERAALVLLRQACALDEWRPRTFTLLGFHLAREGRADEACRALHQARWLRARAGDKARAAVTARLAEELLPQAA